MGVTTDGKRRADMIVNPAAHGVPAPQKIAAAREALERRGWDARVQYTAGPGHASTLARAAIDEGTSALIACGGDGTLNEILQPAAHSGVAVSLIAAGTANVWAREAAFPRDPVEAALAVDSATPLAADLGVANGRYFLLMASVGFDALVASTVSAAVKRRLGATAYALRAMSQLRRLRSLSIDATIDGEPTAIRAVMVVIGNTRLYGGVIRFTSEARLDDGLLDLCVLDASGRFGALRTLARVRRGRHLGTPGVVYRRLREFEVLTPGLPVQLDGEPFGLTPMTFGVAPAAVRLVVPDPVASRLF
jgi:YegS/Rv2252/BmrU family lipid kinase